VFTTVLAADGTRQVTEASGRNIARADGQPNHDMNSFSFQKVGRWIRQHPLIPFGTMAAILGYWGTGVQEYTGTRALCYWGAGVQEYRGIGALWN
jgi:hypothetical protein